MWNSDDITEELQQQLIDPPQGSHSHQQPHLDGQEQQLDPPQGSHSDGVSVNQHQHPQVPPGANANVNQPQQPHPPNQQEWLIFRSRFDNFNAPPPPPPPPNGIYIMRIIFF